MSHHKQSRIDEIDGLRGIAILSVVILHWIVQPLSPLLSKMGIENVLWLTAYGVDLFFVISGFLIGGILLRIGKRFSGMRSFYIRRILRIWPLYYLLLALTYLLFDTKKILLGTPYWTFFFFIYNFWESVGSKMHRPLGILWSIAIEEQFYALGPLMFFMANRKQIKYGAIACVVLSPFLRLALIANTDLDVWRFTLTRLDGIFMGILLSVLLSAPDFVSFLFLKIRTLKFLTFLLFISAVLFKVFATDDLWFSFGTSLFILFFGCLLAIVQVLSLSNQSIRVLRPAFLRYLGLRCYFIYLFHGFFMIIARAFTEDFLAGLMIQAVLTLFFAHLSWRYLESPLIVLGKKFPYETSRVLA